MADYNPSRLGQINQSGDDRAIFLKKFSGEVIAAFEAEIMMMSKTKVKTIDSGKSYQFPASGYIGAGYHTPGAEITGSKMNHGERIVTIDDLLVADAFIANIDEAMNHYDTRSEYTKKMGYALATLADQMIQIEALKGARLATPYVTDGGLGGEVALSGYAAAEAVDKAIAVYDAIFSLSKMFLMNKVPKSYEKYLLLDPDVFYNFLGVIQANGFSIFNKDYGTGALITQTPESFKLAGINVFTTNNGIFGTNFSADTDNFKYHGGASDKDSMTVDATDTLGIAFVQDSVATVKLRDLATEMDYMVNRQGTLMVSKFAMGHGFLRNETCFEVKQTV